VTKTIVLDWQTWRPAQQVSKSELTTGITRSALVVSMFELISPAIAHADSVTALAGSSDSMQFSADASWADYVIPMLKHQGLPLAVTMCCWAALEMILRKPASAIDRAKWAIVGYLGLQFILPFLTHLGHRFGDA